MKTFARKAFTIIEVNMAILILSSGVLALISLFALGFRENRQSREDVGSAALADAVLSRIVMAASATNLKWSAFKKISPRIAPIAAVPHLIGAHDKQIYADILWRIFPFHEVTWGQM